VLFNSNFSCPKIAGFCGIKLFIIGRENPARTGKISYLHPTRASDCSGKPAARFFSGRGFGAKSAVPQQDCASEENCDAASPQK